MALEGPTFIEPSPAARAEDNEALAEASARADDIEPEMLTCSACDGEGEIDCDECGGSGDVECEDCSGEGKTKDGETCTECTGDGTMDCTECYDGSYECSNCNGSGEVDE